VAPQFFHGIGLVRNYKAIHHRGASLAEPDDFDVSSLTAECDNDLVQRIDGGNIPEVVMAQVDAHCVGHFLEIRGVDETFS